MALSNPLRGGLINFMGTDSFRYICTKPSAGCMFFNSISEALSIITLVQSVLLIAALLMNKQFERKLLKGLTTFLSLEAACILNYVLVERALLSKEFYFFYVYALFLGPVLHDLLKLSLGKAATFTKCFYYSLSFVASCFLLLDFNGFNSRVFTATSVLVMSIFTFKAVKILVKEWKNVKVVYRVIVISFTVSTIGNLTQLTLLEVFDKRSDVLFMLLFLLAALMIHISVFFILSRGQKQSLGGHSIAKSKYVTSSANYDELQKVADSFVELMKNERSYRHADVSIKFVAELLNVKSYHLSQAINSICEMTFNEYINDMRVKEAAFMLNDSELSVKEIMYEVGFKSKSSFNTNFKKSFGCSPSEFRAKTGSSL